MAAQLASGFIELTVKYGDTMKQLQKDMLGLDKTAKKAGDDAGEQLNKSMLKAAKMSPSDVKKALRGFEQGAKKTGDDAGDELHDSIIKSAKVSPADAKKALAGFEKEATRSGTAAGKELNSSLLKNAKVSSSDAKNVVGAFDNIKGIGATVGGDVMGGLKEAMASGMPGIAHAMLVALGTVLASGAVTGFLTDKLGDQVKDATTKQMADVQSALDRFVKHLPGDNQLDLFGLSDADKKLAALGPKMAAASKGQGFFGQIGDRGEAAGINFADKFGSGLQKSSKKMKGLFGPMGSSGGDLAGSEFAARFAPAAGRLLAVGGVAAAGISAAAVALFAAVGIAAAAAFMQSFQQGVERDKQRRQLQVQVGLDEDQTMRVFRQAEDAYANNFGASIQDNVDTATAIIQNGLAKADSPELQRMIEQLQTVSQVTGETGTELARSASVLAKTGLAGGGTDAEKFVKAMDLVTVAQQQGLNVSGDLLDTMTEYGIQFKKIGIDGPKALGLVKQMMDAGARNTDLAADAVKEFSIRSIDGSELTAEAYETLGLSTDEMTQKLSAGGPAADQAFGTIIQRLKGIQDPAQRAQVAVKLFGTQAEDLGDSLYAIDPTTAVSALGQIDGAAQKASDALGSGPTAGFESLNRQIEVAKGRFADFAVGALGPIATKISALVQQHMPQLIDIFGQFLEVGLRVFQGLLRGFGSITEGIGGFVGILGDIQGSMLRFEAWQADLRGDDETARQLREQSEAAYGWGDGIKAAGAAMQDQARDMDKTADDMARYTENATKAAEVSRDLGDAVEVMPDGKQIKVTSPDSDATKKKLDDLGLKTKQLDDGTTVIDLSLSDKDAKDKLEAWRRQQTGEKLEMTVVYKDKDGNPIDPSQLRTSDRQKSEVRDGNKLPTEIPKIPGKAKGGTISGSGFISGPGGPTSDSILALYSNGEGIVRASGMQGGGAALVAALNAGWTPSANFLHAMLPGFSEGLNPGADWLRTNVMRIWPSITSVGGKRADPLPEHPSGNAVDIMIPDYQSPEGIKTGDEVAAFVVANHAALGLRGLIWRGMQYGYGGSWDSPKAYGDHGSDNANHMNHIHAWLQEGNGGLPGGKTIYPGGIGDTGGGSAGGGGGGGSGGVTSEQISSAQGELAAVNNELSVARAELKEMGGKEAKTKEEKEAQAKEVAEKNAEIAVLEKQAGQAKARVDRLGGYPTVTEEDDVINAREELATAEDELAVEQLKLDQLKAAGALESEILAQQGKVQEASQKVADAKTGVSTAQSSSSSSGSGSDSDNPFAKIASGVADLADLGVGGLKESFLPPGFSDPTEWPLTKALGGVLGFAGGLVPGAGGKIMQGIGAGLSTGSFASALEPMTSLFPTPGANGTITPATAPDATHFGTGAPAGPGGAPNDPAAAGGVGGNNIVFQNSTFGNKPETVVKNAGYQQKVNASPQYATQRWV